ncbi:hypothetical protein QNH14_02305 [Apirhabdus apintestini]|nr:hypothetical protein [Erwinia sp. HR93]MEA1063416.1 hypothetical protein [Erwinia sp. HR93]WPM85226.1 hypothetical protein QNH14_02305 [Enterobacteriaceae bacterium CA-0114]
MSVQSPTTPGYCIDAQMVPRFSCHRYQYILQKTARNAVKAMLCL